MAADLEAVVSGAADLAVVFGAADLEWGCPAGLRGGFAGGGYRRVGWAGRAWGGGGWGWRAAAGDGASLLR